MEPSLRGDVTSSLPVSRPRIVVVGSYGLGLTVTLDRVPEAGETIVGRTFATGHGGKGSNQAVAAARLGADVSLWSAVGDDQFGRDAQLLWQAEAVDCTNVRIVHGSTMVGVILVEPDGENRIAIVAGVLDELTPAMIEGLEYCLPDANVLVVGLEIPLDTAMAALAMGRAAGVTTILNPAPAPPGPLPHNMLDLVDHLVPNRTEAAMLSGLSVDHSPDELLAAPCFDSVPHVVMTLGDHGAILRDSEGVLHVDAVAVQAVDTTGAGDSFNAAYAVALGRGATPRQAVRYAVSAAAVTVTRELVIPSLPYADELEPLGERR